MGMQPDNLDDSIDFARACFITADARNYPVYLSTKNTILKAYDGRFKGHVPGDSSTPSSPTPSKGRHHLRAPPDRRHGRLGAEMVGRLVWACKNYDGDVQSDTVAQGFGLLGLMTSVLMTPDGKTVEAEAAHGTVTRHHRESTRRARDLTNSVASIGRLDRRAWKHRAKLDDNAELKRFAETLETVVVDTVEWGFRTKDLALWSGRDQKWLTTQGWPREGRREPQQGARLTRGGGPAVRGPLRQASGPQGIRPSARSARPRRRVRR